MDSVPIFYNRRPPCVIITVVPCCFYKDTTAFTDNTMQWLKNDPHIAERQKHFRNSANIISLVIEFKSLIQAMVTLNELSLYVAMKSSVCAKCWQIGVGHVLCHQLPADKLLMMLLTLWKWVLLYIFVITSYGYNISITMFSTTTF